MKSDPTIDAKVAVLRLNGKIVCLKCRKARNRFVFAKIGKEYMMIGCLCCIRKRQRKTK